MIDQLRRAWERVSIYLPVLLMGVFALGTYWLVRSTPLLVEPAPAAAVSHEPDYLMRKFSVKTYDAKGRLQSEVFGAEARHYPDTDTMEIDDVHIRSFDVNGRLTTARAKRALTNSDASEVQLYGDARVVREPQPDAAGRLQPGLVYRGEFLHAFMKTEQVKSHLPVELTRGQDRFTADSMDYDNLDRVMLLNGRVKGHLVPGKAP